jgi:hypothetical protein
VIESSSPSAGKPNETPIQLIVLSGGWLSEQSGMQLNGVELLNPRTTSRVVPPVPTPGAGARSVLLQMPPVQT